MTRRRSLNQPPQALGASPLKRVLRTGPELCDGGIELRRARGGWAATVYTQKGTILAESGETPAAAIRKLVSKQNAPKLHAALGHSKAGEDA